MADVNYRFDVAQPFQSSMQGIQGALQLSNAIDISKENQLALQQRQFALQNQKNMQADLAALSQKPNPTAQDFAAITLKYPAMSEHFGKTWSMMNSDQQQAKLDQASQVYAALKAGKPEYAVELANQHATAAKNSGDAKGAQALETLSKLITMNPATALTSTGSFLASTMGPEKFVANFSGLEKLPSETVKLEAEASKAKFDAEFAPTLANTDNKLKQSQMDNIYSQINDRVDRLALDRDRLTSDTSLAIEKLNVDRDPSMKLSDKVIDTINTSVINAATATQSSNKLFNLANNFKKVDSWSGATGNAVEAIKKFTGDQDYVSKLKKEYTATMALEVNKMLPPGAASNVDVANAKEGFLTPNADPKLIASVLEDMARIQQSNAVFESMKADWLNSAGYLGRAKRDVDVGGIRVPAGTSFNEFAQKYLGKKVSEMQKEQKENPMGSSGEPSYMRHGQ